MKLHFPCPVLKNLKKNTVLIYSFIRSREQLVKSFDIQFSFLRRSEKPPYILKVSVKTTHGLRNLKI